MLSYSLSPPYTPPKTTDIRMFFKKSSSARRALTELGINDSKLNLKMAETLCTITAEQFMKKWNFDPIRCRPLPTGRYQWTPVNSVTRKQRLTQQLYPSDTSAVDYALDNTHTVPSDDADPLDRLTEHWDDVPAARGTSDESAEEVRCCEDYNTTAKPTTVHVLLTPHKKHNNKHRETHTPKAKQCKITGKWIIFSFFLVVP